MEVAPSWIPLQPYPPALVVLILLILVPYTTPPDEAKSITIPLAAPSPNTGTVPVELRLVMVLFAIIRFELSVLVDMNIPLGPVLLAPVYARLLMVLFETVEYLVPAASQTPISNSVVAVSKFPMELFETVAP